MSELKRVDARGTGTIPTKQATLRVEPLADRTGAFERQSVTHLTFSLELQALEWQVVFCICISDISSGSHTHPAANRLQSVRKKTLLTDTSEWLKHQRPF